MAKITLTAEEEIMYLKELDKMQDLIPDLEIQVISEPVAFNMRPIQPDNRNGEEFRSFLQNIQATTSSAATK